MILPSGTWVLLVLFAHLIEHRPVSPAKGPSSLLQFPWGIETKESEEIGHGDWHSEGEADK